MITVDLFGGLGNQMFQYALGRHLALKNSAHLVLRFVGAEASTKREYALQCFKLAEGVVNEVSPKFTPFSKLRRVLGRFSSSDWLELLVREEGFAFDPRILELEGRNIHLSGYWQSEKYFKDIRTTILEDFTFTHPLSRCNEIILEGIKNSNSVSVHARRGDYVVDPKTHEYHGVCSPDYYRKAVEIIAKKVKNPVFYFFSDDIGWVKKNLKNKYKNVYVDWNNGDQSYIDMQLMSRCKHNILANSSFSWWGAWLNQNPDKIVVAPKRWFQDPSVDTRDLIPKGWLKI